MYIGASVLYHLKQTTEIICIYLSRHNTRRHLKKYYIFASVQSVNRYNAERISRINRYP